MKNGRRQFFGKNLHPRSIPHVLTLQGKAMGGENCFREEELSAFNFFLPLGPRKWKITSLWVTCFRLEVLLQFQKWLSARPWCRGGKWEAHGALIPNVTRFCPHPLPLEVLRVGAVQAVLSHLLEKRERFLLHFLPAAFGQNSLLHIYIIIIEEEL